MSHRRKMTSVLHNFLSTYTSRYSDYNGYWLFGMIIQHLNALDVDLLNSGDTGMVGTPLTFAIWLASERFADQLHKADISVSCLREARLRIVKSPDVIPGRVNGHLCAGYDVRFLARAVTDLGKCCVPKYLTGIVS